MPEQMAAYLEHEVCGSHPAFKPLCINSLHCPRVTLADEAEDTFDNVRVHGDPWWVIVPQQSKLCPSPAPIETLRDKPLPFSLKGKPKHFQRVGTEPPRRRRNDRTIRQQSREQKDLSLVESIDWNCRRHLIDCDQRSLAWSGPKPAGINEARWTVRRVNVAR